MTAHPTYEIDRVCRECQDEFVGYSFTPPPTDGSRVPGVCKPCGMAAHHAANFHEELDGEIAYWTERATESEGKKRIHAVERLERALRQRRDSTWDTEEHRKLEDRRRKVARRLEELRAAA